MCMHMLPMIAITVISDNNESPVAYLAYKSIVCMETDLIDG